MLNQEPSCPTIRVLLVDDETDYTSALSKRLHRRGMVVQTAADGIEAYTVLENSEVDVVVLDVQMPGPCGLQILRSIKKRFQGVEVILLSGQGTIRDAMRSASSGAYDYLFKPCCTDVLTGRILSAAQA